MMGRVPLGGTEEVVHVRVYILEVARGGCLGINGLVFPGCRGVDDEG